MLDRCLELMKGNTELVILDALRDPKRMVRGEKGEDFRVTQSMWYQHTTAAIVTNLVSLVDGYGFAPNDARACHINRSQPLLLSAIISEIYIISDGTRLVKRCLPASQKEYEFWSSRTHKMTIRDLQGFTQFLDRYHAPWDRPRPEAFEKGQGVCFQALGRIRKATLFS
ncbi:hypothetical protein VNO77_22936 [Canavalia gladiata]|uniref:Trehalase n=1 Tax=Canavalia gladiata TaxID=3824 RepID=A0AAN9L3P4_CANGL